MRITIELDDTLIQDVLEATDARTVQEAISLSLISSLGLERQKEIRQYRGRLEWTGDLDQMRRN